jgi:hypothetical protein
MIQVDKDIPVPTRRSRTLYPYEEMEVGDSFFLEDMPLQQVCNSNLRAAKRSGKKFSARTEDGGVRVWRIV